MITVYMDLKLFYAVETVNIGYFMDRRLLFVCVFFRMLMVDRRLLPKGLQCSGNAVSRCVVKVFFRKWLSVLVQ
ncbi:hypothetical protein HanHA300_Chr03g0077201 [Helianthus annuus]|nr:hypothetical protein HanHA300_Chr03g0077201 [Helianthus annuus]